MKLKITAQTLYQQFRSIYPQLKAKLETVEALEVEIKKVTRNSDQNRRLHTMLGDLARQCDINGQRFSVDVWKRLCVAAWLREQNERPMMIPSLDGNGVEVIYEKTSRMTVEQCASLITWVQAYGDEQGVKWSAPKWMEELER